jgi:hypothetical protein
MTLAGTDQEKSPMSEQSNPELMTVVLRWLAGQGGRARAKKLTRQRRSEIARNAVNARWRKAGKRRRIKKNPQT